MSRCSICDYCSVNAECEFNLKIQELKIEYAIKIIIPYCEYVDGNDPY